MHGYVRRSDVVTDGWDKPLFQRRLPNGLPRIVGSLEPFRRRLKVVAVESACNWCWLGDGLPDHADPVVPVHPSEMKQYKGIKAADDLADAAFRARPGACGIGARGPDPDG